MPPVLVLGAQLMGGQGVALTPLPGQRPVGQALGQGLAADFPPLLSPQPRGRDDLHQVRKLDGAPKMIWDVLLTWGEPASRHPSVGSPISPLTLQGHKEGRGGIYII